MRQDRYKTYGRFFSRDLFAIEIAKKFSTAEQFAVALKVNSRLVWAWLDGDRRPGLYALGDICKVLSCTIDDIAPRIAGYRSEVPLAVNGISDAKATSAYHRYDAEKRRAAYFQRGRA